MNLVLGFWNLHLGVGQLSNHYWAILFTCKKKEDAKKIELFVYWHLDFSKTASKDNLISTTRCDGNAILIIKCHLEQTPSLFLKCLI